MVAVYRLRGGGGGLWGSGYGLRTLSTVTVSFYGLRGTVSFYGCRKRTLSTVAEVFHNEVSLSPCLFTKNYTGDFEIAPPNTLFMCILRYAPCVRVLGYQIMFPST